MLKKRYLNRMISRSYFDVFSRPRYSLSASSIVNIHNVVLRGCVRVVGSLSQSLALRNHPRQRGPVHLQICLGKNFLQSRLTSRQREIQFRFS